MNHIARSQRSGFSVIEILVVVAIVVLLAAIALLGLSAMRDRLLLSDATNSLIFHLEESKARAVAGIGGVPHGLYFAADSYVQFYGSEYEAAAENNLTHHLDAGIEFSTDILEDENGLVFSRITGETGDEVVVIISLRNNPEMTRTVTIGAGGDISSDD